MPDKPWKAAERRVAEITTTRGRCGHPVYEIPFGAVSRLGLAACVRIVKKRAATKAWQLGNRRRYKETMRRYYRSHRPEHAAQQRRWRMVNPERDKEMKRASLLRRKYGITPEQYARLLAEQGGVCYICRRPPKTARLHVDHCHLTGRVRGLLCHRHNYGLGFFTTREELQRALEHFDRDTGFRAPKKRRRRRRTLASAP